MITSRSQAGVVPNSLFIGQLRIIRKQEAQMDYNVNSIDQTSLSSPANGIKNLNSEIPAVWILVILHCKQYLFGTVVQYVLFCVLVTAALEKLYA